MLNRLFVIIGFIVILGIGAAFVVPRFIQWSDYRGRLEMMATQAFGADVAIAGDIQLTLLPQPLLVFTDVRVGKEPRPAMQVGRVEAHFSLFDFLSDRYRVTQLQLERPVINLAIDADGRMTSGIVLAAEAEQSNVSIADAEVVDGTVRLFDARSGQEHVAEGVRGELRLDAVRGPFSFQGDTRLGADRYAVRLSTGRLDEAGAGTLSLYLRPESGAFTLESTGAVQTAEGVKYAGDLRYRQPPPRLRDGEIADAGRGDLVLEGKFEALPERLLLSSYTLLPDENRAATRLTGAAEVKLGRDVSFNAVVSGGVVSLPPRDATKELSDPPYELMRLLAELPAPMLPSVPGSIGLDIAEVNLRGVALRDVRLDGRTDTKAWTVENFTATLPGSTRLRLAGQLTRSGDDPVFAGTLTVTSQQLDRLAAQWRKPPPDNPLFNMPGSLTADVELSDERLTLDAGTLVVAGINHGFNASLGLGATRDLTLSAHLTTLGQSESAALIALLPDLSDGGSFGATFPKGSVDISASKAVLFGLPGSDLAVAANWEGGVLELTQLEAGDLGGAQFDVRATAFGTLLKPEVSGSGVVVVENNAPALTALLESVGSPAVLREFLHRSLPADLTFQLRAPNGDGGQALSLSGKLGTATVTLDAQLTSGIVNALSAPLSATVSLSSQSPTLMTMQLGLGDAPLFDPRAPLKLEASIEGVPSNSYEVHARLAGGGDHIAFDGNVVPGDFSKMSGAGAVDVALSDASTLAELVGATGLMVPPVAGTAQVQFDGVESIALSEIKAGEATGTLALRHRDGVPAIEGKLALASLDARGLVPLLVGAAGSISGEGIWPEGPIDIGAGPRTSTGRIDVSVDEVTLDASAWLTGANFGFDWDAETVSLRNFTGSTADGRVTLDARVCCSNAALAAKQIAGRVSVTNMPAERLLPSSLNNSVAGRITASAQFDGTGETVAEAVSTLTGSGSYTINDFSVARFNPQMFNSASTMSDVIDLAPDALTVAVLDGLQGAPFDSNLFSGTFTIAGGVLRSPNLAIAGNGARIFGGGNVALEDMTVSARYAMTPTVLADPEGAVDPNAAEVVALVNGPLWAPEVSFDVATLVDGMTIRASERELARLEQLRLEDERRRQELAADRARVAAEQAAAEAARKAAEEEAARLAAEEAARKAAEEEAARRAAEEEAARVRAAEEEAARLRAAEAEAIRRRAVDAEAARQRAAAEAARRASTPPAPISLGF